MIKKYIHILTVDFPFFGNFPALFLVTTKSDLKPIVRAQCKKWEK